MKPIFKVISFTIVVLCAICSSSIAQVKWEVKLGANRSYVIAKNEKEEQVDVKSVGGIYFGIASDIVISNKFSIKPTLTFARRGYKIEKPAFIGYSSNFEVHVSYLELPIDLNYNLSIGADRLRIGLGPYLGLGLGGQWKSKNEIIVHGDIIGPKEGNVTFKNNSDSGEMDDYNYGKPFDYGVHASLSYLFKDCYSFSVDFQQGIANLQSSWGTYKPKSNIRNQSVGLALAYRF